jgi:hypothetical protein
MTPTLLALRQAEARLRDRLVRLEARLDAGDESAWAAYTDVVLALATIAARLASAENGHLLSTGEMAARLGISSKTLLRRKARGEIAPALQLGRRGRAAMRWASP